MTDPTRTGCILCANPLEPHELQTCARCVGRTRADLYAVVDAHALLPAVPRGTWPRRSWLLVLTVIRKQERSGNSHYLKIQPSQGIPGWKRVTAEEYQACQKGELYPECANEIIGGWLADTNGGGGR